MVGSSFSQSSFGARRMPSARNAASTTGCDPESKFMRSGEAGSTAAAMDLRASSAYRASEIAFGPAGFTRFKPGRNASKQSAQRLEIRVVLAIVRVPVRSLDRHVELKFPFAQRSQYGFCNALHHGDPVFAIGRSLRLDMLRQMKRGKQAAIAVPCRKDRREEFTTEPNISMGPTIDGSHRACAVQSEHVRHCRARRNSHEI